MHVVAKAADLVAGGGEQHVVLDVRDVVALVGLQRQDARQRAAVRRVRGGLVQRQHTELLRVVVAIWAGHLQGTNTQTNKFRAQCFCASACVCTASAPPISVLLVLVVIQPASQTSHRL